MVFPRFGVRIGSMNEELQSLPWEGMESIQLAESLYKVVRRVARKSRKKLPKTARELVDAASGIPGKLARSSVAFPDAWHIQLINRHRALKRAHAVRRRLNVVRMLSRGTAARDPDLIAATDLVERVIFLIRIGK